MTDAKVDSKAKAKDAAPDPTAVATDEADSTELEEALFDAPERGSADELLDAGAHSDLDAMRHSTAHVMAEAVLDLFRGTQLGIGPAIVDGFYYDFKLDRPLTPADLAAIEERMAASVAADHPFVRRELPPDEGRALFAERNQPFKVEILDDLAAKARSDGTPMPETTLYQHGPFEDLCKGPHVASTARIGPFKLLAISGAYWRGDEKRPALQRIYGTVWQSQEDLDAYLWRRAEAKKRDHRRLGVALDLFSFHDVSPGSAFWHPKGQMIWRTLEGAMRELQSKRGYQEISTPILVDKKLWQQSGHWDLYDANMFRLTSEDHDFALKPMNCPESTFIYKSKVRSYRDLPLRLNEYGRLHRNERSGTLSGLTRVRQFIQDDAHVYVRPDQLADEIEAMLGEVHEAYSWVGLTPRFAFATKPDKAIGDPALWERAEALVKAALDKAGGDYKVKPRDGTFYAPKIDIYIDDALGREWQMATIQADLTMLPERFDLHYIDEHGQPQRPIAIHRAIYGSLERFIGILVEHFAGAFPFWLAPVQAVVIPIADRHIEAAEELAVVLRSRGLRVDVDGSDSRMQNKIRIAQEQKIPYMVVLGDREIGAREGTLRRRGAEKGEPQETLGWDALADRLAEESRSRSVT
ncbi:MAG TPA: threonine--tRNA ligase [Candidatus Limnocylindrales bacterium]|nr:threonine--tRNA ligase [Candidatus Limnocylindrales bacterium]